MYPLGQNVDRPMFSSKFQWLTIEMLSLVIFSIAHSLVSISLSMFDCYLLSSAQKLNLGKTSEERLESYLNKSDKDFLTFADILNIYLYD